MTANSFEVFLVCFYALSYALILVLGFVLLDAFGFLADPSKFLDHTSSFCLLKCQPFFFS